MGRRVRTGSAVLLALTFAGCVSGAEGPSPTDPHGFELTTTAPTTTATTLNLEEGLEEYRACLADEGVTLGRIRLDGMGRPRMAEAVATLDLTDQGVLDALESCGQLLASGPLDLASDPELGRRVRESLADFAECVRLEGVADYPDPVPGFDGVGSPFPVGRIPWEDPGLATAVDACGEVLGV